jgi:hypothetical protein
MGKGSWYRPVNREKWDASWKRIEAMSLRYEQYNSLKLTQSFLRDILSWEGPMRKCDMREQALACLKHFPHLHENGQPMWSRDEFTKDIE